MIQILYFYNGIHNAMSLIHSTHLLKYNIIYIWTAKEIVITPHNFITRKLIATDKSQVVNSKLEENV